MIQAVIFDLNGVLADSGDCHQQAWRRMAKEQGIALDEEAVRLLPRMEDQAGVTLLLKKAERPYSPGERLALIARKNDLYASLISALGPESLLPGATAALESLRSLNLKTAAVAPDENAPAILRRIGLAKLLDAVVFWPRDEREEAAAQTLRDAAACLKLSPANCLAVMNARHEEAAQRCGMKAILVGGGQGTETVPLRADSLDQINLPALIDAGLV